MELKANVSPVAYVATAPRQRGHFFPAAGCPGAPRLSNQRLQRSAGPVMLMRKNALQKSRQIVYQVTLVESG